MHFFLRTIQHQATSSRDDHYIRFYNPHDARIALRRRWRLVPTIASTRGAASQQTACSSAPDCITHIAAAHIRRWPRVTMPSMLVFALKVACVCVFVWVGVTDHFCFTFALTLSLSLRLVIII